MADAIMRLAMRYKIIALAAVVGLGVNARADWHLVDEPVYIVIHNDWHNGDNLCSVDVHLWVSGPKKEWCVRKLEQAAHVARFEMQAGR